MDDALKKRLQELEEETKEKVQEPLSAGSPPMTSSEISAVMSRQLALFRMKQALYEKEQQFLHEAGPDYEGREEWLRLMKRVGRA